MLKWKRIKQIKLLLSLKQYCIKQELVGSLGGSPELRSETKEHKLPFPFSIQIMAALLPIFSSLAAYPHIRISFSG